MKLSQTLYARAEKIWPRYLCHPFVTQMADGTLPPEKFRYYMLQDYLYLKDYVKIFAAIIQKADDFEQIRFLSGELADTIAGYVSESYRRTNQMLIDRIDALSGFIDEKTAEHLCEIFEKCCLFDLRFWDMVYAMGGN